jgi:hypothetical protein
MRSFIIFFVTLYLRGVQVKENETAETENAFNNTAAKSEGQKVFRMIILKFALN